MVTQNQKAGMALARGFIVFIMPAVHSIWLYSTDDLKGGWLGITLGFLSEGPGAQLFMFLMGVFIVLGKPKTIKQIVKRSFFIFLIGYVLNLFKLVIPYYTGWIPSQFFTDNHFEINEMLPLNLLLIGDILQFAAIAYLLCSFINKLRKPIILTVAIILIVLIASPKTWDFSTNSFVGTKFLELFNGSPPYVFFPVFPWLFYPLLGLLGGKILLRISNMQAIIFFTTVGILMILIGSLLIDNEPIAWNQTFYRLGTGGTLKHGGIVLGWLAVFLLLPIFLRDNYFFRLLKWLSKNITIIYLVQWVVVMWMLPLFGYNHLTLYPSLLALFINSIISFLVPYLFQKYFAKQKI